MHKAAHVVLNSYFAIKGHVQTVHSGHRPPGAEFPRGRIPQGRKIPQGPIFCAADLHFELERTGQKSIIPGIEDNWSKTGNPISEPQIPSLQHVKNVCSKISEMSIFCFYVGNSPCSCKLNLLIQLLIIVKVEYSPR